LPSTTLTATAAAPGDFTVYAFDDVAEQLAANEENTQQTSEEILLSIIDGLQDDKLTGFALRLALTAHTAIPRESEIDFLYTYPGFDCEEVAPWQEDGEKRRALKVTFPDSVAGHTRNQISYFGPDGLLRRHEYTVDVLGNTPGLNYASDYRVSIDLGSMSALPKGLRHDHIYRLHPLFQLLLREGSGSDWRHNLEDFFLACGLEVAAHRSLKSLGVLITQVLKASQLIDAPLVRLGRVRIEICFLLVEDFLELIHLSLLLTSVCRCRFQRRRDF
jgi:hypothetical protein